MAYYNATKVECRKEELKNIVEEEACPYCGGDLSIHEAKYLYCKKCEVSFFLANKENRPKIRGYSKNYENYKKSEK